MKISLEIFKSGFQLIFLHTDVIGKSRWKEQGSLLKLTAVIYNGQSFMPHTVRLSDATQIRRDQRQALPTSTMRAGAHFTHLVRTKANCFNETIETN